MFQNARSSECARKEHLSIPSVVGNPWKSCLDPLLEEDRLKCEAWRDEVQNLLLFAGLFSAVVTAFVIQSYQDLQPNSGNDQSIAVILAFISQNSSNITNTFDFYPSASAIRINTCWFMSLILSLMTVLVGIVSLQWIREYQKYQSNLLPKRAFSVRNLRSEGLDRWYVPEIFAGLPLLLQSALVLFLVGLTDFLLHLNIVVACPAIAITSATLLFLIVTSILPPIQALWLLNTSKSTSIPAQCPYKSPQSWVLFRIISSLGFRTVLNLVGDAAFHVLVAPVSCIGVVCRYFGTPDHTWTVISYLHVTLKLKTLGSLRDWSELDGFWMDERQRLYTRSKEPCTYFQKMTGNVDCDAARGIAHVVDGRASEEPIAIAVYHCFRELPSIVVGDDIFRHMSRRLPLWMTSGQPTRKLTAMSQQDSRMVRNENEMFFLARLPHTSIVSPIQFFRRRQLELFVQVLGHILVDENRTMLVQTVHSKAGDTSKLLIPTCLKTVERVMELPQPLLGEIQEGLINVFQGLVKKAAALENEHCTFEFPLQSEQVLGDFMQLLWVITLSLMKSTTASPSSNKSMSTLSSSTNLLAALSRETRRSMMSGRPSVNLAVLYVSRFCAKDWASMTHMAPDFSQIFGDLAVSLDGIGLTTFNFTLHRTYYRKRCEDTVNKIKGRPSMQPLLSQENDDVEIVVEVVPKDLQDDLWTYTPSNHNSSHGLGETYDQEQKMISCGARVPASSGLPKCPERAKIRLPTKG